MMHHRDAEASRQRMHQNLAEPANGLQPIPYLQLSGKRVRLVVYVPVAAPGRRRYCKNAPFLGSVPRCLRGE
jgi:hypothetical protein